MSKKENQKISILVAKKYFIYITIFSLIFIIFFVFFYFYKENKNIIIKTILKQTNNKIFYLKNNIQIAVYSKKISPSCSLTFPSNIKCLFNYKDFKTVFLITKNKKQYQFPLITVSNLKISIIRDLFSSFSSDDIFNNLTLEGKNTKISKELIKVFKLAKTRDILTVDEYNLLVEILFKKENYFKYQIKKEKYNLYNISTIITIKNFLNINFNSYVYFDKKRLKYINKIKYIKISFYNPLDFQKSFYLIYKSLSLFIDLKSLNNQLLGINSEQLLSFSDFKNKLLEILSYGYSNCVNKGFYNESQCFNLKILRDVFIVNNNNKVLTIEKNLIK